MLTRSFDSTLLASMRRTTPASRLLVCLPLLLFVSTSSLLLQCTLAAPQYFMTVSTSPLPAVAGVAESLSMADDAPFVAVSLSFDFPFYQPTRYLWIDPNGALHMHSSTPPCCVYSSSPSALDALPSMLGCSFEEPAAIASLEPNGTVCTFDTSVGYTDLIAPSLLDLDPSQSPGSVQYVDSGSELLVQWVNVPWWVYGSQYNTTYYSFEVLLSIDGSILFHYTSVTDPTNDTEVVEPSLPSISRSWLVAVRQESWRDTETANAADYSTNRTGLYPPKQWVTDGSTIRFCPIDTSFCMWPTAGTLSGTTLVLLASANMTCASVWNHTYALLFQLPSGTVLSSDAEYNPSTNTLQALTPLVAAGEAGLASVMLIDVTANATVQLATPLFFTFYASVSLNRTTIAGYCTACGTFNPYFCTTDCAGEYMGSAVIDMCGQCSGGTTNVTYNSAVNCAGTCGLFTSNWTVSECLCEQLQYPPVVEGWVPGTESMGEYVGPVSYYVHRKLFDASVCGLSWTVDEVYVTLRPLNSYQSFLLAATSLLLVLALTQVLTSQLNRPLWLDPFHPSLYMSEQPPAVVVEPGGVEPEVREEEGAVVMNEAAVEAGAEVVRQEREARESGVEVQRVEEVKEDAGMSLGASELWRRRQAQLALGREQLTPLPQDNQEQHRFAEKEEKANEAQLIEPLAGASVEADNRPAIVASVARPSAFVPPVASPFTTLPR